MNKDQIAALVKEMHCDFNKYNDNKDYFKDEEYYKDYCEFKKIFFDFFENDVIPEIKKLNRLGDSIYSFIFKYPSLKDKSVYLIIHFLLKIHEEFFKGTGISFQHHTISSDNQCVKIVFNWRV